MTMVIIATPPETCSGGTDRPNFMGLSLCLMSPQLLLALTSPVWIGKGGATHHILRSSELSSQSEFSLLSSFLDSPCSKITPAFFM